MTPADALAQWWDSKDQVHSFSNCNLFVSARPPATVKESMSIYDALPYRYPSVEGRSLVNSSCLIHVRSQDYTTGWDAIQTLADMVQDNTGTVGPNKADPTGPAWYLGHGRIRSGPVHLGHIADENAELFSMTISIPFGTGT